jgi:hypothetical protein
MSDTRFACPNCHTIFRVVVDETAPPPPGQRPPVRTKHVGEDWKIECPVHGWSYAKYWEANERGPATVTCKRKDGDEWCKVRVKV